VSILTSLLGPRSAPRLERYGRLVLVAVLVAMAVDEVYFAVREWPLHDMDVYLGAAMRLRTGQPLYIPGDVAVDSFWYAPWFAVAWMPLTFLPRLVVAVLWSAVLLAATAVVTVGLGRIGRNGPMLALLVGPLLFAVSAGGNIQALMVLSLLWGFNRCLDEVHAHPAGVDLRRATRMVQSDRRGTARGGVDWAWVRAGPSECRRSIPGSVLAPGVVAARLPNCGRCVRPAGARRSAPVFRPGFSRRGSPRAASPLRLRRDAIGRRS